MDAFALILPGVILLAGGIALSRLASLSDAGKLKPNGFAGVRTGLTLRSKTAWFAAQHAAAKPTAYGAWAAMIGGFVVALLPTLGLFGVGGDWLMWISLTLCIATATVTLIFMLSSVIKGERAAQVAVAAEEARNAKKRKK